MSKIQTCSRRAGTRALPNVRHRRRKPLYLWDRTLNEYRRFLSHLPSLANHLSVEPAGFYGLSQLSRADSYSGIPGDGQSHLRSAPGTT
jgi:hypothetical protein